MNKYIYDKDNGLWYELQGDYYIPCLYFPKKKHSLSDYGDNVIANNKHIIYTTMLI